MSSITWTRRRFASTLLTGAALGLPMVRAASASERVSVSSDRWIELVNTHTAEVAQVKFATADGFVSEALDRLQHLLRDYRVDEQHAMDPGLYLQLSDLATAAGREPRFQVISGYRSPHTNAQLRAVGHGVAEHSLHMEGRAIDVRLHGCTCSRLRDLALAVQRGGVGYYARSDFVHIDTGRVRFWTG